jgi:hypothetical protein
MGQVFFFNHVTYGFCAKMWVVVSLKVHDVISIQSNSVLSKF